MLSWHLMHVTVRLGSPGPSPCPTDGALSSSSCTFLESPAASPPFSCSCSLEGAMVWIPVVAVGLGALDATVAASTSSFCSPATDGLIEQEFLCFSRFRTNTLTPHWKGHRTSRSSQPCGQEGTGDCCVRVVS